MSKFIAQGKTKIPHALLRSGFLFYKYLLTYAKTVILSLLLLALRLGLISSKKGICISIFCLTKAKFSVSATTRRLAAEIPLTTIMIL